MKRLLVPLLLLLSPLAHAAFQKWSSADGRTAELNLLSVSEVDGEKVGRFTMRSGQVVELKASQLSEADAERMAGWKPVRLGVAGRESVFDGFLDGNLLELEDGALVPCEENPRPEKYYLFYYTALWCGPCQRFTPILVDWYLKNRNDNFELVVISWDRSAGDMAKYATAKKMPWKLLKLGKADDFQRKFRHKVSGIPSVITCDLEGNIVSRTEAPGELSKLVK